LFREKIGNQWIFRENHSVYNFWADLIDVFVTKVLNIIGHLALSMQNYEFVFLQAVSF